ncbi:transcription antitermination factor NusB [Candidatus Gracilibacteria bacterium]|nr:transcription antitermination factor NusB [Candidatus Gracilibacteria bacterium]
MSTRHIARTLALQTLFELDMKGELSATQEEIDIITIRNRDEYGEGVKDMTFTKSILSNVLSRRITLDDIITRAAPDWPLDKIGMVDRNILRIGLSELLFGDRAQVPPKVAIDEAIELAKSFGGETSGRFVNGVLGAIYKEMGEPEKAQITKSKKEHFDSAKKELLAGAVVCSHHENKLFVGLVHDVFGYWTLPKGKIEEGENEQQGAEREIKEEIGIQITIKEKLGENEYIANKPEKGKVVKHVSYFLAYADYSPLTLEHKENKGGLDNAEWFDAKDVPGLRMYDDIKPLINKAIEIAKAKNTKV